MKPNIKIFSSMLKEVPTIIWRSQYHFKTTYGNHLLTIFFFYGAKTKSANDWPATGRPVVGQSCGDFVFTPSKKLFRRWLP